MKRLCDHNHFIYDYCLASFDEKAKSGYCILKEIEKKTDGNIMISKGTLYPIIDKLEKDGLIELAKIGQRQKKCYKTTNDGKKYLKIRKCRKSGIRRHMWYIRKLFCSFEKDSIEKNLFEISALCRDVQKRKALDILKRTKKELQEIYDEKET